MLGPLDGGALPFQLNGQRAFRLELPADGRHILAHAARGEYLSLVPGLVTGSAFLDLLADPDSGVDVEACRTIVYELAEDIFGVPWWTAGRLAASAEEGWDQYAAYTVTVGFDPSAVAPAHRHISAMLAWLRTAVSGDAKKARRLEMELFKEPPHLIRRGRMTPARAKSANADAKSFLQQMQGLGGAG